MTKRDFYLKAFLKCLKKHGYLNCQNAEYYFNSLKKRNILPHTWAYDRMMPHNENKREFQEDYFQLIKKRLFNDIIEVFPQHLVDNHFCDELMGVIRDFKVSFFFNRHGICLYENEITQKILKEERPC